MQDVALAEPADRLARRHHVDQHRIARQHAPQRLGIGCVDLLHAGRKPLLTKAEFSHEAHKARQRRSSATGRASWFVLGDARDSSCWKDFGNSATDVRVDLPKEPGGSGNAFPSHRSRSSRHSYVRLGGACPGSDREVEPGEHADNDPKGRELLQQVHENTL